MRTNKGMRVFPHSNFGLLGSTRANYAFLKRAQLLKFLTCFSKTWSESEIADIAEALSHDCQGITLTSEGYELELLANAVNSLEKLGGAFPPKQIADFISEMVCHFCRPLFYKKCNRNQQQIVQQKISLEGIHRRTARFY